MIWYAYFELNRTGLGNGLTFNQREAIIEIMISHSTDEYMFPLGLIEINILFVNMD